MKLEDTLLVVDGLDELKPRDSNNELLRIIHKRKNSSIRVFVTTRPHVLPELILLEGKTFHQLDNSAKMMYWNMQSISLR